MGFMWLDCPNAATGAMGLFHCCRIWFLNAMVRTLQYPSLHHHHDVNRLSEPIFSGRGFGRTLVVVANKKRK